MSLRFAASSLVLCCGLTRAHGQAAQSPRPANPVAIENSNASFSSTDVDIPQANPARPTVTIPAHIPPTGYLQFEQGVSQAGHSPGGTQSQLSFTQTTKIALTTRLLVQLISQPYAYSGLSAGPDPESHSSDPGDLQLGVQGILHKAVGAMPTAAAGYLRRVRAGTSASLDAGELSQEVLFLFGGDLRGGFHYDSNIIFDEQNNGSVRKPQFAQTLAVTHLIFPVAARQRLSSIVELTHYTQPFTSPSGTAATNHHANAVDLLLVATYTVRPNLILDASVDRGLTSTSTHWQGGFGVSYILPHRLWPDRKPLANYKSPPRTAGQ